MQRFGLLQDGPIMPAESMPSTSSIRLVHSHLLRARGERPAAGEACCLCVRQSNQASWCPVFLRSHVAVGDEITFPDSSSRCSGYGDLRHQECRLRTKPLYLPGANRIRQPAQAGQTKSALRFGRGSPWRPWHQHGFPALRGPARVLLSPAAYGRQSRSSHPVRGLAYPGQRFSLRASRRFQAA